MHFFHGLTHYYPCQSIEMLLIDFHLFPICVDSLLQLWIPCSQLSHFHQHRPAESFPLYHKQQQSYINRDCKGEHLYVVKWWFQSYGFHKLLDFSFSKLWPKLSQSFFKLIICYWTTLVCIHVSKHGFKTHYILLRHIFCNNLQKLNEPMSSESTKFQIYSYNIYWNDRTSIIDSIRYHWTVVW